MNINLPILLKLQTSGLITPPHLSDVEFPLVLIDTSVNTTILHEVQYSRYQSLNQELYVNFSGTMEAKAI